MKIWLRFALYFTAGLLFFAIFLAFIFPFLLGIFIPQMNLAFVVEEGHYYATLLMFILFVFCLLTGSLLFSLMFVKPVLQIISSIQNLAADNQIDNDYESDSNGNKFRLTSILFKEIVSSIQTLANNLQQAKQERAELEQAKKSWIMGVSHDLKTPLSYITGYSSLLLTPDHSFTSEEYEKYLAEIYHKGIYISELIEDLNLSFYLSETKILTLNKEPVELVQFIQSIINDITHNPKSAHYDFSFISKETILNTEIDKKLIHRALYNLLINCIEHNPAHTRIIISLRKNQQQQILLDIQDNGVGMNKKTLENCLNMHYSKSKANHYGKGIGLYVVKNILDAHQAELSIQSELHSGTHIQIILPASYSD